LQNPNFAVHYLASRKRLLTASPRIENQPLAALSLRGLRANCAGFGDSAGIVRDEKPRLDGVGGIPDEIAGKSRHERRDF
jgi:hypothetical protein